MNKIHFIHLKNVPIFEQLQLEEALLRSDDRNFCIVNQGSNRAIVMGISGQPNELIDESKVKQDNIPVIKRFSGGGTVIVDDQTLFVTFIMSKDCIDVPAFPEPILRWTADLYTQAWKIPGFQLKENDYCLEGKKCGGNAQYIKKDRWLHHTSFLWDYSESNMEYLLLPKKRPQYRQDRAHQDFLCRLKQHAKDPQILIEQLKAELNVKRLYIEDFDLESWQQKPHRQATQYI
jgi:lipoate-protein ligase A